MSASPARRRFVLLLAGLVLLTLGGVVIGFRAWFVEEWMIYKLRSEDRSIADKTALELAALGCERAIPALVRQAKLEKERGRQFVHSVSRSERRNISHYTDSAFMKALHDLGPPAQGQVEAEVARIAPVKRSLGSGFEPADLQALLSVMGDRWPLTYSESLPSLQQQRAQPVYRYW